MTKANRNNSKYTGGNALVRQSIHAKYSTYVLHISISKLKVGDNSIMLITNKGINRTEHYYV